ncbi:MAG: hypothetical protein JXQ72_01790 [Anaerolineae bacterium]|nr:hypothetical protein [Anaerolineae bacterium]
MQRGTENSQHRIGTRQGGSLLVLLALASVLVVLLAACGGGTDLPKQTTTPLPVPTITPTPTPLPTITPTPQVSDIEITVVVITRNGEMPGDGRSTAPVRATVNTPPGLDLEGATVFFRVEGGGSVDPTSAIVTNGQANTTYTAGETGSRSPVVLSAIIDVLALGRAIGTAEFVLVRQSVSVAFDGPVVVAAGVVYEVPFTLHVSSADNLGGRYSVVLSASDGTIQADEGSGRAVRVEASAGSQSVRYIAPTTPARGSGELCAQLADRMVMDDVCTSISWGPPAAHLDVAIPPQVYWSVDQAANIGAAAFNEAGARLTTYATVCYRVGLASSAPPDGQYFLQYPAGSRMSLPGGECVTTLLDPEKAFTYTSFKPWPEVWVVEWEVSTPGYNAEFLQQTGTTVFTPRSARIDNPAAALRLTKDGATLVFVPDVTPVNFWLHTMQVWDDSRPTTTGLIRFYIPEDALAGEEQPGSRTVEAVSSWNIYRQTHKPDMNLTFTSTGLSIDYLSNVVLVDEASGRAWREVFVFVEIDSAMLSWQ